MLCLYCFLFYFFFFFFSSRRRHTRSYGDWSSDVCSSDLSAWISASNRNANSVVGLPVLKRGVTPAGGNAVRFSRNRMSVPNSPVSGRSAFSIAYVFKADTPGANDAGANWYGKTGVVDAEQGGITADWGTVLTETGQVGIGSGSPDLSTYSTGASLV